MRHEGGDAHSDDRGLIFFAGHGYTKPTPRGAVGYLVPVDGSTQNLASMIRWDELTNNAQLLPAKHILFIIDACFSGLAVSRYLPPGSKRFLKDVLVRQARQVLTAGKGDQQVADRGGPQGNSIFTGHLLDALGGAAAGKDGIVTANSVIAYVYDRVSKDNRSNQTPHYGYVEGDGDFVFSVLPDELLKDDNNTSNEIMVGVPMELMDQADVDPPERKTDLLKEYLAESRFRIRLDDFVGKEVRKATKRIGPDHFPTSVNIPNGPPVVTEFARRLTAYEEAIRPLQVAVTLLGKWAGREHSSTVENIFAQLSSVNAGFTGNTSLWTNLRWFPISCLLYSGGVAAITSNNYDALAWMHLTKVDPSSSRRGEMTELVNVIVDEIKDTLDTWKYLPGHENQYIAYSEYMYKSSQPLLEDVLHLGSKYEAAFDKYEVLRALIYADIQPKSKQPSWTLVGRYVWKHCRSYSSSPYTELLAEAKQKGENWPPLKAGLFGGSYERFEKVAEGIKTNFLSQFPWHY